MRLWHKDLIPFLPRQQLLGQWRECCLIARQLATNGTPNHILVNRIMDYPIEDFMYYGVLVINDMKRRGYTVNEEAFRRWFNINEPLIRKIPISYIYGIRIVFPGWHDDIYLRECLYNLEEKYRAGGITQDEWDYVYSAFCDFTPLIH